MTRQVIPLGVQPFGEQPIGGEWHGALRLDAALVDGGGEAWLREIDNIGSSIRFRIDATASGDGTAAGPEWSAALEGAAGALTFAEAGGASVTLPGPGHADNAFADQTEPYFWTPPGSLWGDWLSGLGAGEVTLTLDDGITAIALRCAAEAGAAEAAARVDVLPALALSDFDAEGLELDVLALIRAGAGPQNALFAAPPRGTVGALLDGELGIGSGETEITRIRRRNGNMLVVNDNAPLSLSSYFSPGGAGADLTLYIQTIDGVASLPVSTHGPEGGNFIQFGAFGGDFRALLDSISAGDRFIFVLARQAYAVVAIQGAAEAGGVDATVGLVRLTPDIRSIRGAVEAGAAEIRGRLFLETVRAIRGAAAAHQPQARARVVRVQHVRLRGRAAAGASVALARIQRVAPPDVRYRRALRETAPTDRLLTALEIRHPAVAVPVRVINDTQDRTIEGNRYIALRFDARLADDIAGQAPQAELGIDNVGRELTQWIEAAGGGVGASARILQVLDIPDPPVEWEVTMDVAGMAVDSERVTARLGFDPLLGGAAVTLRHDPETSPGLF